MNSSQYSYTDNRNGHTKPMNRTQSVARDLTTRPMRSDQPRLQSGTGMTNTQNMTNEKWSDMNQTVPTPSNMSNGLTNNQTGQTVITPESLAGRTPTTVESPYYTAGFLKNFIGKNMRVEFLIGTSGALVDRTGELVEVGASYIVLRPLLSDDLLMADLYSIKFVTIYQ